LPAGSSTALQILRALFAIGSLGQLRGVMQARRTGDPLRPSITRWCRHHRWRRSGEVARPIGAARRSRSNERASQGCQHTSPHAAFIAALMALTLQEALWTITLGIPRTGCLWRKAPGRVRWCAKSIALQPTIRRCWYLTTELTAWDRNPSRRTPLKRVGWRGGCRALSPRQSLPPT